MQLIKFFSLALATIAVASPVVTKRDANTVIADLKVVQTKANTLNDAVVAYKGGNSGYIQAIKIQSLSSDLEKALNQTTSDAQASAPFTDEEAVNVGGAVGLLQPDVITLLDNIKNKKAAFDSGFFPLSSIVYLTLKNQQKATQDLATAVIDKVPEDLKSLAPSFTQPILDKFAEVIKVYQPSFGGF